MPFLQIWVKASMTKAALPLMILALGTALSVLYFFSRKNGSRLEKINKQLLLQNDSLHIRLLESRSTMKQLHDSIAKLASN